MFRVLGLTGSPRRGGNTETLLDSALQAAQQAGATTEKVAPGNLMARPCQHCDGCLHTGVCIIDDDMQPLHKKLLEADRLVLATPIFFMTVSAQTKTTIDRCQALWVAKYLLKQRHDKASDGSRRRGLWIGVAGTDRPAPYLFDGARMVVRAFFAACDVEFGEELLYTAMDKYREVHLHPTALQEARDAGSRLVSGAGA
ncbi:MAG: flavodoxin family protein [Dehalococcoidia bacterium]|nr:flavodoxin family protein [Dehalococcoidia bacterium]MDP7470043.1 flavodoxin family protein [Dehalococcoidia bacterium]